ncbi:patatin-domain-containing protein [Gigaspora margarita]|uniref:Patatin-domain-containing protein n=1 Tax=Gigaspora margarita TaxID=4874 RepID=A0A8H4AE64_GIGMA|nr:patatin-domain-containing protein [Gigaspora margarita]
MSIIIGPAIAVIACSLALIVVLLSFIGLEKFELPIAANSTLTGYPTWHIDVPGLDANRFNTILLFSSSICFFASILSFYWAYYPPHDKRLISHFYKNDSIVTSTRYFNLLLANYIFFTWLSFVAYMIFDIGKLWSPIGLLCNVAEISLLACVHYGGKITAIKYWVWVLRYFIVVIIGCVWLDWPYDALWYQVQAQTIEVLIVITFIRLYFTTRKNLHEHENHLPPNTEQDNPEPGDQSEDTIPQEPSSEYPLPLSFLPQPKQLIALVFPSIVHLLGDSLFLIFLNHPNAYLLGSLSYALSYGIFAYYIWLDTHCYKILPRKRIYAPETSTWEVICITVISVTIALVLSRLSCLVLALENH